MSNNLQMEVDFTRYIFKYIFSTKAKLYSAYWKLLTTVLCEFFGQGNFWKFTVQVSVDSFSSTKTSRQDSYNQDNFNLFSIILITISWKMVAIKVITLSVLSFFGTQIKYFND